MSESSVSPVWFPIPTLPPLVSWTVEANGSISRFTGPGAALAPMGADRVVGQHYTAVLHGTDIVRAIPLALAGRTVASMPTGWGRRWFTMLQPEHGPDGAVLRAHGTSFVLPEDAVAPEALSVPAYRCDIPTRGPGYTLRPGDVVADDGRVMTRTEVLPDRAATHLRRHVGSPRLTPLGSPPPDGDPPVPGASVPPLRVLP